MKHLQIVKFTYEDLLKTLNNNYYLLRKRKSPDNHRYDYFLIKIGIDSDYITKISNGSNLYPRIQNDGNLTLKYIKDTWDEQIIITV